MCKHIFHTSSLLLQLELHRTSVYLADVAPFINGKIQCCLEENFGFHKWCIAVKNKYYWLEGPKVERKSLLHILYVGKMHAVK